MPVRTWVLMKLGGGTTVPQDFSMVSDAVLSVFSVGTGCQCISYHTADCDRKNAGSKKTVQVKNIENPFKMR